MERRGYCDLTGLFRKTTCRYEDSITWIRDDVLNIRIFPGETFDLVERGYHPILAGRDREGKKLYIAWYPGVGFAAKSPGIFCTVAEGAGAATARDVMGVEHTVHDFFVFLLRYEPAAYPTVRRYAGGVPTGAKDMTGPLFWRRNRDLGGSGVDPLGALRGLLRLSSQ